MVGVVAELVAQAADVHPQVVDLVDVLAAPDLRQERRVLEDVATNVVDFMALLRKSLDEKKRTPAKARAEKKTARKKTARKAAKKTRKSTRKTASR